MNKIKGNNKDQSKNELKNWFFRKINIDKPLTRLIKKKTQINKIRNEIAEVTADTKEINTKDYKKISQTTICQQIEQFGSNG